MMKMPRLEWNILRRAHQLLLLVTLAVLWGLAATSFFMTRASSIRIAAAPARAIDAARVPARVSHPSTASVEERTLHGAAPSTVGAKPPQDELQLAPQQLQVLHKLLGLKATSLSQAQRATYAAALRSALRQLSPAAPPEVAPPSRLQVHQGPMQLGAAPGEGYARSEPAAAPESIGAEHSADTQEGEQEGEH